MIFKHAAGATHWLGQRGLQGGMRQGPALHCVTPSLAGLPRSPPALPTADQLGPNAKLT